MPIRSAIVNVTYIVMAFIAILVLNWFCIECYDGLCYAFSVDDSGQLYRNASLLDIIKQQYHCYFTPGSNGRVFVHGIVAIISSLGLHHVFDVLNTFVWFGFVYWVVFKAGGVKYKTLGDFSLSLAVVSVFCWYAQATCKDIAFSVNYLWSLFFAMIVLTQWDNLKSIKWCPLLFIFGWTQEVSVLPTLFSIFMMEVLRLMRGEKLKFSTVTALLSMTSGAFFLVMGPASAGRANSVLSCGMLAKVIGTLKSVALISISLWPVILVGALCYVIYANRSQLKFFYIDNERWIWFTIGACGLCFMTCDKLCPRLFFPLFTGALILVIRNRCVFPRVEGLKTFLKIYALVFMFGAAYMQYKLGTDVLDAIDRYRNSTDGVTYLRARSPSIFMFSVDTPFWGKVHYDAIRAECGHDKNLVLLTQSAYNARSNKTNETTEERESCLPQFFDHLFIGRFERGQR